MFSSAGIIDTEIFRFNWVKELSKTQLLLKKNIIKISFLQWLKLFVFEDVKKPKAKNAKAIKAAETYEKIMKFDSDLSADLSLLKASLRNYQQTGVNWLWFLYRYGLSGLLCDEMGLGKTHQAMGLLAAAKKEKKGQDRTG